LGLLLEDRPRHHDADVSKVVGAELSARRLTRAERDAAVDGLIAYLEETGEPHPMAVWALVQSNETRAVPVLIALLERWLSDPGAVALAYQALIGVLNIGMGDSAYGEQSLIVVQRAATEGHADVAETAQSYLRRGSPEKG
jgi:hypothetical protein